MHHINYFLGGGFLQSFLKNVLERIAIMASCFFILLKLEKSQAHTLLMSDMKTTFNKLADRVDSMAVFFRHHRVPVLILILALFIVSLLHIPLSVLPLGRDQGVWITAGMAINSAYIFFKDFLHFNLPGLGFSYSLILKLVSDPHIATMLLSLVGCILIIISMYLLLQETISKSAAAWSVILFAVIWPTYVDYWSIAQKDFMAMYGVLFGTWLLARADIGVNKRLLSIYASGFAIGFSIMYKPIFAIAGIMLALAVVLRFCSGSMQVDKKDWRLLICDLLMLLAGVVTVAASFMLYLSMGGALENAYNGLFVFAPSYSGINTKSVLELLIILLGHSSLISVGETSLLWVPIVFWFPLVITGMVVLIRNTQNAKKAWLLIPMLTALFTYFIQGKGFLYHVAPWQICLFMIAGCGISYMWRSRDSSYEKWNIKTWVFTLILTLGIGLLFSRALFATRYAEAEVLTWAGQITREEYLKTYFEEDDFPHPLVTENLAAWIGNNTLPEEQILVWGFECQLYALSNRLYAANSPFDFILSSNLLSNPEAIKWQKTVQSEFLSKLKSELPKLILIVSDDVNPVEPVASNESMANISGFSDFISEKYTKEKDFERFEIFKLK